MPGKEIKQERKNTMNKKNENPLMDIFVYVDEKKQVIFSVVCSIISVIAGFVPYIACAMLVNSLMKGQLQAKTIYIWGGSAVCGYLIKTGMFMLASYCSHKMAYSVMAKIRTMMAKKLLTVSLGDVKKKTAGEYKQIIMDEIEHLEYPLAHMIPELTSNILGFVLVLLLVFVNSWQLGLAAVGTLAVGFVIYGMMMAGSDVMGIFKKYTADSEHMSGAMVEYVKGMEVIKAYGQTASSMEKFSSAVLTFRDSMKKWFAHCYPYIAGFYVVTPNSLLFVLPLGALLLSKGIIDLSSFIFCMFLAFGVAEPLIKMVEFADQIMAINTTMTKVNEFMAMEDLPEGRMDIASADVLEMKNVNFGYDDNQVLKNISFRVKKGQRIAFVGASGSGKSTIAKLLVRFYDPQDGAVLLNGRDIRNTSMKELMDQVSYVTQDNFLIDASVFDNIKIGNENATKEQVIEAAKKASCHQFIMEFADGYDTSVGGVGGRMSGGQKQRIAIARTILKEAPIVILDEATAFMDPENENLVQNSMEALTKDKTLIMIAHRLQTVVNCDCIYVMNQGEIVASGSHEELLKNCEIYINMWKHNEGMEV